jgi:hypothetical protein
MINLVLGKVLITFPKLQIINSHQTLHFKKFFLQFERLINNFQKSLTPYDKLSKGMVKKDTLTNLRTKEIDIIQRKGY